MNSNKLTILLLTPLCVAALSFGHGYAADPACKPSLMEKIRKTENAMEALRHPKKAEDPLSEQYLAAVDKCSEQYEACAEKCAEKDLNDVCDAQCKEALSLCEKDLPQDWKTIK